MLSPGQGGVSSLCPLKDIFPELPNHSLPGPSVGFPDLSRCDEVLDSELGWDCAGPSSR